MIVLAASLSSRLSSAPASVLAVSIAASGRATALQDGYSQRDINLNRFNMTDGEVDVAACRGSRGTRYGSLPGDKYREIH